MATMSEEKYTLISTEIEEGIDFQRLVDSTFLVTEFTKQMGVLSIGDEWLLDAEALLFKVFAHSCTIKHIIYGTPIPIMTQSFPDVSSIKVLTRALLETTLVFYYLFITSKNDSEKQLRYLKWQLSDLLQRQSLTELIIYTEKEKLKESQESDIESIKILRNKILNNDYYSSYTPKQKKSILNGFPEWRLPLKGKGHRPSWIELGEHAGLNSHYRNIFYKHLSSYAHSGSLSILQLRNRDRKFTEVTVSNSLSATLVSMALMIKGFWKIVPMSKQALNELELHKKSLEHWFWLGTSEYKRK